MKTLTLITLFFVSMMTVQAQDLTIEEFMSNPFPEKYTPQSLMDSYWWRVDMETKPVESKHKETKDTIKSVHIGGSRVEFYISQKKTMLLSGYIKNRRIDLRDGLFIWMPREDFFSSFSNLDFSDREQITLTDENDFYRYTFTFKFDRLRSVEFSVFPD